MICTTRPVSSGILADLPCCIRQHLNGTRGVMRIHDVVFVAKAMQMLTWWSASWKQLCQSWPRKLHNLSLGLVQMWLYYFLQTHGIPQLGHWWNLNHSLRWFHGAKLFLLEKCDMSVPKCIELSCCSESHQASFVLPQISRWGFEGFHMLADNVCMEKICRCCKLSFSKDARKIMGNLNELNEHSERWEQIV